MRWSVTLLAIAFAGCSGLTEDAEVTKAEQAYNAAKSSGSAQDKCDAAREVEKAFVAAADTANYQVAKLEADAECAELSKKDAMAALDEATAEMIPEADGPREIVSQENLAVSDPAQPARERCWQDYCPCEETRDMDRLLCRNIRGGVAVDDEMMAAGAAMRDARNSLDDWEAAN